MSTNRDLKTSSRNKKKSFIYKQLMWVFMIGVICSVITAGIITNKTLRSIEKNLPNTLLLELNDLSNVLENLAETVHAADRALISPDGEKINFFRHKLDIVYDDIIAFRESYVFDNLVQASAFHAVVAPAIADLKIWLTDGVSGFDPDSQITVKIAYNRISDAYQKARSLNKEAKARAQKILEKQRLRLDRFLFSSNLLFGLTIIISLSLVYLLLQQYALQRRESLAQTAIQDQQDLLNSLFDNVLLGITVWNQKGELLLSNRAFKEITGYSSKDVQSLDDWFDRAYPDSEDKKRALKDWNKDSDQKNTMREFNITCNNNETKAIEFRDTFLPDGRALFTMADITDRKIAEKDKISAQRIASEHKKLALVGQIAGKMAHDFNNILGIVMGNTELALIDCTDAGTKEILTLIFKQTVRGKNLTKNLVAFAKDQEPKQEYFKIHKKIDLVLNLLKKELEGIAVTREDDIDIPELLADPGMIEHALVNIIQNSIHAMSLSEYPKIILRSYLDYETIVIGIEDNGCGIPEESLERIYEPAFTLKGSKDVAGLYKAGIRGTGYGMANVKKYIEQHKGLISVNSEIGIGTLFTICLPVYKKELTIEEKTTIKKEITQKNKSILIVEDEAAISDVQYRILTQDPCNHNVDIASTGQIAMDLFNKNNYDFISLDYILPGGSNGMDVYNHIREINKTIPILFISGNIEFLESIKDLKYKDPYIDHLSKPCKNIDYLNGINKLLA